MLAVLFILSGCAINGSSDAVISVDSESVTVGEIRFLMAQNVELINSRFNDTDEDAVTEFWNTEKDGVKQIDTIKKNAVENLINYAVISKSAKSKRINVDDKEVDARLNAVYTNDSLIMLRDKYGVPKSSVKEVIRKQVLHQKYVDEVLEDKEGYFPTEEALMKLFNDDYYKAQHILIKKNDSEEPEKTLKRVERILEDAQDGEDFLDLMTEYSEDTASFQYPDGYVFTYGEMNDTFYNTVVSLEENQISEVVETSYGYHIIKRVPVTEKDFADSETELINKYKNDYINSYTEQLKAEYNVIINEQKLEAITVNTEK